MPDDPMDPVDATWIPPEKKIVWCPVHQQPMESCACGRDWSPGTTFVALLLVVVIGIVSLAVAALTVL